MLQLTDVAKTYGSHTVIEGVNLKINPQSRIGLVGRNGAGKSTLFKLLMGELEPDKGKIARMPGTTIRCLTQEPQITHGNTLLQEVMSAFPSLQAAEEEEARLVANWGDYTDEQQVAACDRLAELATIKEQSAQLEGDVSRLLTGLGFELNQFDRLVEHFSGGWQMRINLAKVLLQGADFLLLDEPTNHLDLEAREWLEAFLREYPGGLLVVTHDRLFLDQVVTEIAEIELGKLTVWPGNYTQAQQRKAEAIEKLKAAADRQNKELAKQQEFIDRFRASATKSTQAKSREKQLAKVERIEPPKTDTSRLTVKFPVPPVCGRQVLTIKGVKKSFGAHTLFSNLNAELERKQRIFLLGANGAGKTTLLRLVLGLEKPDSGEIKLGLDVALGYFSQHQLETLDPNLTALQTLEQAAPITMDQTEVRGILGRFLFSGDRVLKKVSVLSGGEKSRLALARLILSDANFLLLDEPTNHMDIPAQLVMEQAFKDYQGSILCISHDRYLIAEVATDIWELYNGQLIAYNGNYEYYLEKRAAYRAAADKQRLAKGSNGNNNGKTPPEKPMEAPVKKSPQTIEKNLSSKELAKLEKAILKQEAEVARLHQAMAEVAGDYLALQPLTIQLAQAEAELTHLNTQWEAVAGCAV